ncbi:unnamed protein product [Linum trigynum]|uniref:Reverse transcriptase n=1 Tax=Linum trigynum TaxID=586398 RepID=A0AAV2DS94_9ROSI
MKDSVVDLLDPSVSDHCPVLLNTDSQIKSLPKPFKFFKFWISHPKFYDLVKEAWDTEVTGSPLGRVCKKLRVLKKLLRELNKEEYSDLRERVRMKEKELQNAQAVALVDPSSDSFALVKEKEVELRTIRTAEESFLKQKSRDIWLKEGDSNSSYFHRSLKIKNQRNTIRSLINEAGERVVDTKSMSEVALRFYQNLLGKADPTVKAESVDFFKGLLQKTFPSDLAIELCRPVTTAEVKKVMFGFKGEKSPGPYGYSACFFQSAWSLIGEEITAAIQHCFSVSEVPLEVNSTLLSLLPKTKNPEDMKNFRPISCCNIFIQVYSKDSVFSS